MRRYVLPLLISLLILPACQTTPLPEPPPGLPDLSSAQTRDEYLERHGHLDARFRALVAAGDLAPGLSDRELLHLLGEPSRVVRHDHYAYDDIWLYSRYDPDMVMFLASGRLVSWRQDPHPRPFSPQTEVSVLLEREQYVSVVVYDLQGGAVDTLAHASLSRGLHKFAWNPGKFADGSLVPSGVYLARIAAEDTTYVRKLALVR